MAVEAALDEVLIRFRALKLRRVIARAAGGDTRSRKMARRAATRLTLREKNPASRMVERKDLPLTASLDPRLDRTARPSTFRRGWPSFVRAGFAANPG